MTKSLLIDPCQTSYLFFSTASEVLYYNNGDSADGLTKIDDQVEASLAYDSANRRLYLYLDSPGKIISYYLDGSGSTSFNVVEVQYLTVDGRNNVTYYRHKLQDRIWIFNMTSGQASAVEGLSDVASVKDLEMDVTNGLVYDLLLSMQIQSPVVTTKHYIDIFSSTASLFMGHVYTPPVTYFLLIYLFMNFDTWDAQ